jgi:hypothetical protein
MAYIPPNPNGVATSANSAPVVTASDDANLKGLAASGAGAYVRQDSNATIAKESGGNLATLAGAVSSSKVNVNLSSGSIPAGSNTIGNVEITDGTNTANVVAGDTGFNGLATASATKTYTFSTTTTGASTVLANTPCEGYSWIEVIYSSVGSGLALQGVFATASGGTYIQSNYWSSGPFNANVSSLGTSSGTVYSGPIQSNFFQIAVSALTSGTFAGTVILRATPPPLTTVNISGSIGSAYTVGSSVPGSAFYQGIVAKTSAPAAATTGNLVGVLGNVVGMPVVASALLNSAVAVSSSATVVKAAAGYLSGVLVSAAGTAQALTIYDNASAASGTVIGVIPAGATAGQYYPFNMPAANGITCSGSSNNPAVTVAYS